MARRPELERFCADHGLLMISIADMIRYRRRTEKLVRRVGTAPLQTTWGEFDFVVFESVLDGSRHVAFVRGDVAAADVPLVRVHSECLTGDVFGSGFCQCGRTLDAAMRRIVEEGAGVLVYLRGHEGRGLGVVAHARRRRCRRPGRSTSRRRPTAASTASGPRSSPTSASPGCA